MRGVDFLDSLIALYWIIRIRSRKWQQRLLYHFIDMVVVQCWPRYKKYSPLMGVDDVPLQDFTMDLVLTLHVCIWLQKAWRFSFDQGTRDNWTTWRSLPPPIKSLPPYAPTILIITQLRTDGLNRTG